MKDKIIHIVSIFCSCILYGQSEGFKNYGNVQLHTSAEVGVFTNLINDGKFDENKGFIGFYHDTEKLVVLGKNRAIFYNVEVGVPNNLELKTSLGVANDFNFLEGKVVTPRFDKAISLDFINYNMYVGEDDTRYVDGYTSVINSEDFSFPIGHDDRLRPMILPSQQNNFKGAYFFETPENPTTFSRSFTLTQKQSTLGAISPVEFWDLDGETETTITLTWDSFSNISFLVNNIEELTVVGWNEEVEQWQNLGNTFVEGDLTAGKITSSTFIPDTYSIITLGNGNAKDMCVGNYLISPNGDNKNEQLKILCLENYPPVNELSIYNRWGVLVYRGTNYKDTWDGTSEGRSTFMKEEKLPVGTYYYIFKYGETSLAKIKKGWVYINR